MQPVIVVHHHEITLKRDNRGFFEKQLLRNIRLSLAEFTHPSRIRGGYGRFIIEPDVPEHLNEIGERLKTIFGLANICTGVKVEQDIGKFCEAAESILVDRSFSTIRVETRRPDKNFPTRSMDVNAKVG